jgi:glutaredoxin 3
MKVAAGDGMNKRLIAAGSMRIRHKWSPCDGGGLEKPARRPHIRPIRNARVSGVPLNQPASQSSVPIVLYTSAMCGYCVAAKNFLKSRGLQWSEIRIDLDPAERERMMARSRRTSVPQIFIGDTHVGGYDDMMALHRAGRLEPLLEGAGA